MYIGKHIPGLGRGKVLGFPTINLQMSSVFTEEGVFLVKVFINSVPYYGLLHAGARPTFELAERSIEIFLLDFQEFLSYEILVSFEILCSIRSIQKFDSPEALVTQIQKDLAFARHYISSHPL